MGKKNDYRQYLKQTLGGLIDRLDLSDLRKDFLKNRWLDQVLWLEGRATRERNRHYFLRMITIVGGVIVPALIGFENGNKKWQDMVGWSALGLSQAVAVSAALEEFFAHGEKYRNYRNTAEGLKIEGWQFLQMTGPYHQFDTHSEAYAIFAQRVEQYIQQDVQGFISQLQDRQEESKKETKETAAQNTELALEKLNEQLQLQAQYEAQLQELEAEKQRMEAERQQWEQEYSADSRSEELTEQAAEDSDQLTDLNTVAFNWQDYEEDHDSTSLNPDSVQYLSAKEILARIENNPLGTTSTAEVLSGATLTTTSAKANQADPAKVAAVLSVVPANLKSYAEKSVPLILQGCAECGVTDPAHIAYIFATTELESHLGQYMNELGGDKYLARYNGRRDLGNTQPGDGPRFKGRGFCQVTGRTNYKKWSERLGIDLVSNPEKAADQAIAAKILVMGMRDGVFTGKKLSDYISSNSRDFRNARRIINGLDKADHIAAIANRYYQVLA
ncbi:DUF4231 domain-containing protein [Lyngbya aestuarii]|uniref:DUF4231 domain-containing protein n=1 Tax=Lyngbya aestuarii TaxID=118322 RepID=UPI00403E0C96